jgi:hypothetical protein
MQRRHRLVFMRFGLRRHNQPVRPNAETSSQAAAGNGTIGGGALVPR